VKVDRTVTWTLDAREKHRTVDVGFLAADRDKRVAAGVLAGGVAYRFFFWILALALLVSGALGFVDSNHVQSWLEGLGVDSSVAESIQGSTQPSDAARWWLLVVGLWLCAWTGYLGAKAMVLVHAAVWGVPSPPIRRKPLASAAFTGTALAFVASMAVVQWLRAELPTLGLVTTLAVVAVPFTGWLVVSYRLPHQGTGVMGLVPGAALVALGVQALHIFTAYFLGPKLVNATELYGVLGVVSTALFWLYLTGRLVIGAATLNASLYEQRSRDSTAGNLTIDSSHLKE